MLSMAPGSARRTTVAAYAALAAGDVEPLLGCLAADVEWAETVGRRLVATVRGRDAVAALIAERARRSRRVAFRGLTVRASSLTIEFDEPWWDTQAGSLRRLIATALGTRFTQTVTFGDTVERIESSQLLAASLPEEQDRLDLTSALLGR